MAEMEPGGHVQPEVFRGGQPDTGDMRKRKSWGKAEITMEQKKNRLHYAWFILAGCCILQGATLGLINNCAGVFYSPICKELGFELGKLTMYRMLYCISSALALPFVATSFRKHDVRIVISIAAVIYGGCAALMGTFHELWQWHLTGIIQGIASSFVCMIPAPIILGNWFKEKDRNGGGNLRGVLRSRRHDRQQLSWNGDPGIRMEE
ncbi:MAG: hypothetical protein ACLUAR_11835 [Pilosibacter sp.]